MNLKQAAKLALAATAIGAATPDDAEAMYVGPKAKGWDKLKNKFSSLYDKMTRAEISDADAVLKTDNLKVNSFNKELYEIPLFNNNLTLEDILKHDALYEQYPKAKKIPVKSTGFNFGLSGAYNDENNIMYLAGNKPERILDTILHEGQHYIQKQEGFASGGNVGSYLPDFIKNNEQEILKSLPPIREKFNKIYKGFNPYTVHSAYRAKMAGEKLFPQEKKMLESVENEPEFKELIRLIDLDKNVDKLKSEAYNKYKSLAGEIEARDTASRMGLTQGQRASKLPYSSENINPQDAIVKLGVGGLAAGTTLSQAKDALAAKHKKMESEQALQDAYSPVDMVIAGATGGATMGLRAISALADPVVNYALDRLLGD